MFFRKIDWKKFLKLVIPVPIFLSLCCLANPTNWWLVPTITGLWSTILLLSAHSHYIMRVKPKLTIKELRSVKLRKINRRRWVNL